MCSSLLVGLGSGAVTVVLAWKPGGGSTWEGPEGRISQETEQVKDGHPAL